MRLFGTLFKQELVLLWRHKGTYIALLSFALLSLLVFVVVLGPNSLQLATLSPLMLWVTTIFVSTLMAPLLFDADLQDGTLEHLYGSDVYFGWIMLVKACLHGFGILIQATLLLSLCAIMFHMKQMLILVIFSSFLLGIPGLSALAALSSTFVLGMQSNRLVTTVLIFPLLIPILIFACGAITAIQQGVSPENALWFLGATSLFVVPVSVLAGSFALKTAVQSE